MSWKVKASIAVWLLAAAGVYLWQMRKPEPLEAIVVDDGFVTVRNETSQEWLSVRIWVNDHYAGSARLIPAGGFVREPLSRFVTASGQPLNAASTKITSVVVLATTADGTRVRVPWGKAYLH
jgi:tetraacyldisaccharide-1-P 4'-kinase